jgi:sugar phosphate isomerase/epimerase
VNQGALSVEERLSPCIEWIFAEAGEFEDRVAAAAGHGFKQVEFWYWRKRGVDRLATALETSRVGVSAMVVDPQADIADPRVHEMWLKSVEESAAVAAQLGSPVLVVTAGRRAGRSLLGSRPSNAKQLESVTAALARAAAIGAAHGCGSPRAVERPSGPPRHVAHEFRGCC